MDDDEMANYPGLTQRDGVWQVRKRIPVDLRHIDPRGSIRISLGTTAKREAVRAYSLKLAEIEAGFEQLRAELRAKPAVEVALATARIEDLGRQAVEGLARDWWNGRSAVRAPNEDDGRDRAELLASLDEDEHHAAQLEVEGRDMAREAADRLLVDAGVSARPHRVGPIRTHVLYPAIDRENEAYRQLVDLVRQGLHLERTMAKDYVTGERTATPHPIFNPTGAAMPSATRTVAELLAHYWTERERLRGVESTARKFGLLFRAIEEVWGDTLPLSDVTRERCVELVEFFQRLPANGTKKFPKASLTRSIELAEAGGHKKLAPNTVASYVQNLRAVLRWAKRQKYGVDVDTEGLVSSAGAEVQRRGLRPSEMRKLFDALTEFRDAEPHKFWVPALAAYTGARAGELCQLRAEDVIEVGGISCLNLTRFDPAGRAVMDKRFKNKTSERYVPLHHEIIASGFMDYVASCDGKDRLFPALQAGSKGYSHNFSKWFGRMMSRVDLSDPSLVFHSFRHGFRDACRAADIREEIADALGGWASITQGQRYGDRGAVPNLERALQKIEYGDFRLTTLSVGGATKRPNGERRTRT